MKSCKIEYICPELCHFYGDHGNLLYIQKKAELMGNSAQIIETPRTQIPKFAGGECDMLYISPTNDRYQEPLIEYLRIYKKQLADFIENGGFVLATGNSKELFSKKILDFDGKTEIPGLDMFDFSVERFKGKRDSFNVIAMYNGKHVAGYKNLVSTVTESHISCPLFSIVRERGEDVKDVYEGIKYKNFYATYLLGPLLVQNPYFSDEILEGLFKEDFRHVYLPFEKEAYEKRVHDVLSAKNPDHNG